MEKLNKLKANAVHQIASKVITRFAPDPNPELISGATLEDANKVDRTEGDFVLARNMAFTVRESTTDPKVKAEALVFEIQQAVNIGAIRYVDRLARMVLDDPRESKYFRTNLGAKNYARLLAAVHEKLAWREDLTFGFEHSLQELYEAETYLNYIPISEWTANDRERFSTIQHFKGRATFGLAKQGIQRDLNLDHAMVSFQSALALDENKINQEQDHFDKAGFGNAWLARVLIAMDDPEKFDQAEEYIEKSFDWFRKQAEISKNRAVMAPAYMVKGEFELAVNDLEEAKKSFTKAFRLRTSESHTYRRGLADAYLGLAAVSLYQKDIVHAAKFVLRAVAADKYAALRTFIGS